MRLSNTDLLKDYVRTDTRKKILRNMDKDTAALCWKVKKEREEEEKSSRPGGIRTHNRSVFRRAG